MCVASRRRVFLGALVGSMLLFAPGRAEAQRRAVAGIEITAGVTLTAGQREAIRSYYVAHPQPDAGALPPGIRKKLARGKPLPPGIAKKTAPTELVRAVAVPAGYQVVEVGLDVLLVEVATGIIHDILMDVVR
jgi:hypothetical protein